MRGSIISAFGVVARSAANIRARMVEDKMFNYLKQGALDKDNGFTMHDVERMEIYWKKQDQSLSEQSLKNNAESYPAQTQLQNNTSDIVMTEGASSPGNHGWKNKVISALENTVKDVAKGHVEPDYNAWSELRRAKKANMNLSEEDKRFFAIASSPDYTIPKPKHANSPSLKPETRNDGAVSSLQGQGDDGKNQGSR